jgi:hypothetical protein
VHLKYNVVSNDHEISHKNKGGNKMVINLEEMKQEYIMLEMALKNERDYEEFLKKNNLPKSWDTWDMFAEEKWGY